MTAPQSRVRAGLVAAGLVGAGLAVGLVVTQFGIASADTPTPQPSYAGPVPVRPHFDMRGGLPGGPLGGELGLFRGHVLHGQATVQTPDGTEVDSMQDGSITSLAGSTVTVRSTDGFTRSYTVDKDTRIVLDGEDGALSSLKRGDKVHVMAVQDGDAWDARALLDGVPDRPMAERWREFRQDGPEPEVSPSASA